MEAHLLDGEGNVSNVLSVCLSIHSSVSCLSVSLSICLAVYLSLFQLSVLVLLISSSIWILKKNYNQISLHSVVEPGSNIMFDRLFHVAYQESCDAGDGPDLP